MPADSRRSFLGHGGIFQTGPHVRQAGYLRCRTQGRLADLAQLLLGDLVATLGDGKPRKEPSGRLAKCMGRVGCLLCGVRAELDQQPGTLAVRKAVNGLTVESPGLLELGHFRVEALQRDRLVRQNRRHVVAAASGVLVADENHRLSRNNGHALQFRPQH